jgi:hypothetical protein
VSDTPSQFPKKKWGVNPCRPKAGLCDSAPLRQSRSAKLRIHDGGGINRIVAETPRRGGPCRTRRRSSPKKKWGVSPCRPKAGLCGSAPLRQGSSAKLRIHDGGGINRIVAETPRRGGPCQTRRRSSPKKKWGVSPCRPKAGLCASAPLRQGFSELTTVAARGAGRNRTDGGRFAVSCLTTWRRRPAKPISGSGGAIYPSPRHVGSESVNPAGQHFDIGLLQISVATNTLTL